MLKQLQAILLFLLFFAASTVMLAQNLDKIGKKDMVRVNGGLNYSSVFYNAQGITDRRQPFTWFLNGNVTLSVLDVSLPFTFNYSNNQIAYTQPFNIQSFNPTYKWIKGYAGITSMNFSQYTLANHVFTGGGLELSPKNFKFALMYGRLKKAVEYDTETNSDATMSYKRMGWGGTAGYEKNGHGLKLIYFSAKDDKNSLTFQPVNSTVKPMENTVVSVIGKTNLFKKIRIEAEYALSGITRDVRSMEEVYAIPDNKLPYIFSPNATSKFFNAFKSSIGYNYKIFGVSLNYERVDPEYQTLGAYFFNNDLENITIAPTFNLLKGKLNLSFNTGLQRNNLDNSKLNTSKRWVGSVNVNYALNKQWNLNGSYSNFSTFTKQRPQEDPYYRNTLDTLNFYQLSQNATLSASYSFGQTKTKQSIVLSGTYQVTGQNQGNITDPGLFGTTSNIKLPMRVLNGNLGHNIMLVKSKVTISTSLNLNHSEMIGMNNLYFGPNINLSKSFVKNTLRITVGTSYNQMLTNSVKTSEIFNYRLALNYLPKFEKIKFGKVSITSSLTYLQKLKTVQTATAFSEITANVGASYNF